MAVNYFRGGTTLKNVARHASWRAREREPNWGSGGFAPSGVQGQSPWSGGLGASPPEADDNLTASM
jgi:hypothetical protein